MGKQTENVLPRGFVSFNLVGGGRVCFKARDVSCFFTNDVTEYTTISFEGVAEKMYLVDARYEQVAKALYDQLVPSPWGDADDD